MFRISIAGDLPDDSALSLQLTELMEEIKSWLSAPPQLLVSPAYTDARWQDWLRGTGCDISLYAGDVAVDWAALCTQRICLESPLRYELGEELCDRADLLLLVWDGAPASRGGATWELLRMAREKSMPCLWISSLSHRLYWPEGSYYEPYQPERLKKLCETADCAAVEPGQDGGDKLPFLHLGKRLRAKYLRRFKASSSVRYEDQDWLLREDYVLQGHAVQGEPLRRRLLEQFLLFDASAIRLNERYQAVIYWRAILPFVSTIFISVGFYATVILAALPLPVPMSFWQDLSALGFLLYGVVNLYVFSLSRNATVKTWHKGFLQDRYVAELLRVAIHFLPFGIRLDLRRLCAGKPEIGAALRHMAEEAQPGDRDFTREDTAEALIHLRELLEDQIAYHDASEKRFRRLVDYLELWSGRVIWAGFIVVLCRAGLQMIMPFLDLPEVSMGAGVKLSSFIGTLGNMLALLVPAVGSYYASKLTLCNFRYDSNYHRRMLDLLSKERERMKHLQSISGNVPAEAIHALGQNLAQIMLVQDTADWLQQYESSTVTRM